MKYAKRLEGKRGLSVVAAGWPLVSVGSQPTVARRRKSNGAHRALQERTVKSAVRHLLHSDGHAASESDVGFVLGQMSDAFLEGLALFTSDGHLAYVNDALCTLLNRRRAELLGRRAADLFGSLNAEALLSNEDGGRNRYDMEVAVPGGKRAVLQVSVQGIAASGGRRVGSFAVFMDMSARAGAEEALRRSENDLRLLSAQLLAAQELERQRIARELHDGIGQALGGVKCGLEVVESLVRRGAADAATHKLLHMGDRIRAIVQEVRRIAMNLRPSTLDDLGVVATMGWMSSEFRSVYAHLDLETLVEVHENEIPPQSKTAIYRIAQEALNNVATHSRATQVTLAIRRARGHVELTVRDNGDGFDPARYAAIEPSGKGMGLASMRERAESSGGRFSVRSAVGAGTEIKVAWPLHHARGG